MFVKITIPIAAAAVVLALALAGCSSGGLPGGASGGGSTSGGATSGGGNVTDNGPTNTYTASDLIAILKKVQTARNLSGTIMTDAELRTGTKPGESLTQTFTKEGGKFVPAACGTLLDSLEAAGDQYLDESGWRGATLDASTDLISVATASDDAKADAIVLKTKSIMSQMISQCGSMTIDIGKTSIGFKITNATASTNGNQTFAYNEEVSLGGAASSDTETIEAVYGNLFIGDVALSKPNVGNMEANVNAVISAANG
jgi:hypothetical protein